MRFDSCAFARTALAAAYLALHGVAPSAWSSAVPEWSAAFTLASAPAPPGLRLVWDETGSLDPRAAIDRLERAGFHVAVSLPPHLFYVRAEDAALAALPSGCVFKDQAGDAPQSRTGPSGSASIFDPPPGVDPFDRRQDAFLPVEPPGALAPRLPRAGAIDGLPFGARWTDTSEFMIGRVAVAILFPESDGSTDPNHYDWTPALRDSVLRATVRGLAGWSVFAAQHGVSVSFALEVRPGLATRYEPIDRTVAEEENWIQDVLTGFLGYRSDAATLEYDAANAARARLGAQWGVLMFPVQNDTDPDGAFPDGYISHARLGGPFFVTPVNNLNTAATLDFYIRHELAHAFWALDEHFGSNAWWACSLTTGYLNQPNYNSVIPAPGYCGYRRACLMYANYPDSLCEYTQRQIGWADRDANGRPDLLETRATVSPDSEEYRAVAGSPITLYARALEGALGNQNPYHYFAGDTISAATIDSVVYRVVPGPWMEATPLDGVFDSGREYVSATVPPLPPGEYLVQWDVWNSNGLSASIQSNTLLTLRASSPPASAGGGQPTSAGPYLRLGPSPSQGPVRFRLEGKPGSAGWGTIHDVRGRAVARWRLVVPGSGVEEWVWNGRVAGGAPLPSGLYFLSIDLDGASLQRRLVISH